MIDTPRWLIALSLSTLLIACGGVKDAGSSAAKPATEPAAAEKAEASQQDAPKKDAPKKVELPKDAAPAKPKPPPLETPKHLTAPAPGAVKGKLKLAWVVLTEGSGPTGASDDDEVAWHYRSWNIEGRLLFDTYDKGAPKDMKVRRMLKGYREAVRTMKVGERRRVWIPGKVAHKKSKRAGDAARRIVEMELVAWRKAPPAPKDLRKPPKDAKTTSSGLRYKVLKPGDGTASPQPQDRVEVRYAGWRTKDARCFDFTGADETSNFGASSVIKGWVEGLALMVEGQRVRMWIPAELAYKGKPGKPQGTLVFDVELVKILTAE